MKGKTVLHLSRFEADPLGHGGKKRTTQVLEILERNNFEVVDYKKIIKQPESFLQNIIFPIRLNVDGSTPATGPFLFG